jgi:hypothetical protein
MSLLFCDGFDTGDYLSKWSSYTVSGTPTTTPSTSSPFSAGKSLNFAGTANGQWSRLSQTIPAVVTVYIGFAINVMVRPSGSNGDQAVLHLLGDGGTTSHVELWIPISGPFQWRRGGNATPLGSFTTPMANNQWYYVEARITISDTIGEITWRVDGNVDGSLTNIDTKNAGTNTSFDTVQIGWTTSTGSGTPGTMLIDDFYVADTSGSRNNSFLGPIRIQTLSPNAAGSDTGLTPTAGSNYQNVSDQNASSYNYSAVVGTRDSYNLPDLAVGTSAVLAVRNVVTGQNSDAGAGGFKPVVRSGGTIYYDPTVTVGATSKVYSQAVRETDPATSAAWTVAGVNALQVGAEVS